MTDLLLTGGTVVTVDTDRRVVLDGAVAIDHGRIVAVGPADEIARQYPATGRSTATARRSCPG